METKVNQQLQNKINGIGLISLLVDYDKPIEQAIFEGNYDWKDGRISKKQFPVSLRKETGKVNILIKLFDFPIIKTIDEIVFAMNCEGFQPGITEELLALGTFSPDLQREFPIAALGSVWRSPIGSRFVPVLDTYYGARKLNVHLVNEWTIKYRFLGVRIL